MKCRYCDSFVPDYYNNCPHCGAQLIKDGFSEQHSKPAVNKTPTVDKRKVLADNNCNKEDISGNELKAIGMTFLFMIILILIMLVFALLYKEAKRPCLWIVFTDKGNFYIILLCYYSIIILFLPAALAL